MINMHDRYAVAMIALFACVTLIPLVLAVIWRHAHPWRAVLALAVACVPTLLATLAGDWLTALQYKVAINLTLPLAVLRENLTQAVCMILAATSCLVIPLLMLRGGRTCDTDRLRRQCTRLLLLGAVACGAFWMGRTMNETPQSAMTFGDENPLDPLVRDVSTVLWNGLGAAALYLVVLLPLVRMINPIARVSIPLLILIVLALCVGAFGALASAIPTIIVYVAVLMFPAFRRLSPYTRPRWLPRIRPAHVSSSGAPRPCFK